MSTTPPQLPRLVREYIAAEKESARVWLRAEIDRFVGPLVDSVFDRLTNKLMAMNMDWDRILPGARVVKREIKEEIKDENEMTLQNVVDSAPKANEQIGDCVKQEIKEEFEDGQMTDIKEEEEGETNEVDLDDDNEGGEEDEVNANNATDIDTWFDRWMRDEVELGEPTRANLELMPISNEPQSNLTNREDEGDHVNRNTQHQFDETNNNGGMMDIEEEEEVGDGQTRATDFEELAANEGDNEESSSVENAQIGTTMPHLTGQTRAIVKQSATHSKRKQTDQVNNQKDTEEEDEDGQVDESSRHVKIPRLNTAQPNLVQPNRQFECSHCHKSFDRRSDFTRHLRVHTGERSFQCDQCDKRFRQRADLARHQRIHQNIKEFRCHECDKQFTRKDALDSHLLQHSGVRPFACRHCAKSFTKSDHRTNHEQAIHRHVKPYRCKQCGHTATQRSAVIQHIRMVHFGLPHTIKVQQALNIIDDRDPRELVEIV